MRVLSRKFTKREKFLLSVLCLILVGFVYMQLIYTPIQNRIAAAESEKQTLEAELMAVNTKVERIESMERELESLVAQGKVSYMGSYNNSKA
ncbi:MAG: type II secretion system protein GspM, partial [Firmicutes bacterium]|nr:type II secretion system protein GspM [Bacillota bacterium]